ncbi:hypothetical protein [Actinomadura parmotrematis]|uniref:DUF4760 domain-containing protein n=1 Tax=Actinomadura parmotrematis TaxID=2864039 RepID=A0ABS7FWZ6_9ACTN|nr:hypothetical protein [Actinomadura parmotrematis]MBW8484107.1 hypothetical protein [Actinomadura parmotrematis]
MNLTENEVRLLIAAIPALGSVFVSYIAIRSNRTTSRDALSHQERVTQEERLWNKRADIYIELLEFVEKINTSDYIRKEGEYTTFRANEDFKKRLQKIESKINAFASQRILDIWFNVHENRRVSAFLDSSPEFTTPDDRKVFDNQLASFKKSLNDRIREELGSTNRDVA